MTLTNLAFAFNAVRESLYKSGRLIVTTYFKQLHNAGPLLNIHHRAGSFGSAVDERTRNNCMRIKCLVHIFSGSLSSAVDKRARNNCMRIKCLVHIFRYYGVISPPKFNFRLVMFNSHFNFALYESTL